MQCIEIPKDLRDKQFQLLASGMKLPFHGLGKQGIFKLDETLAPLPRKTYYA